MRCCPGPGQEHPGCGSWAVHEEKTGPLSILKSAFSQISRDPDLLKAQYAANINQIPLMYFLVVVGTWGLASSFFDRAPAWLSIWLPVALTVVATARIVTWVRLRHQRVSAKLAFKALRTTNRVSGLISLAFVIWALALTPYADDHTRGHVAFYLGITSVGCMFCLMHIRSAALMMAIVVNGGFVWFAVLNGDRVFLAEAINVVLASAAMLVILRVNFKDFEALIDSRRRLLSQQKELVRREAMTRQLSEEAFRLAYMDDLTELPNRRHFFEELGDRIALRQRGEGEGNFFIGVLDLDEFKRVNDVYGHTCGDRLLRHVAERLIGLNRNDMFLARLGGDEFALLIDADPSDGEMVRIGSQICQQIEAPMDLEDAVLECSVSIGFARWTGEGQTPEVLYEQADYALYQVKRGGKAGCQIFGPDHEFEVQRARVLERSLRSATFERELSVVFQPIIDTASGRVLAFESLARWNSDVLGPIPPVTFIPIAERIGLIDSLTFALLRKALPELARWPEHVRLSFNLSAKSVTSSHFIDGLIGEIEALGARPERIDFEITETAMIDNFAEMASAIERLKLAGFGIALDDFGTGYSSLVHLHRLPLDKIKIDKSFVCNLVEDLASCTIVRSLLALGRQLQVGCIVEGVETAEIRDLVRDLGGSIMQGYHFARPMAADRVLSYLEQLQGTGADDTTPQEVPVSRVVNA